MQGTNLFTSSSDGSFSINTNFANDRLTNLAVDQAQDAFDDEIKQTIKKAEDTALKEKGFNPNLEGDARTDALKKVAKIREDEFLLAAGIDPKKLNPADRKAALDNLGTDQNNQGTGSTRKGYWDNLTGDFTDGLSNLGAALSIGGLQATGASGFVDEFGNFHPRTCFTAGTKIHKLKDSVVASAANIDLLEVDAELEELVNIEDVKTGNFVRSWNEKTGKMSYKKVSNTFERVAEGIYNLELSNGEMIQPTWNHPFWVLLGTSGKWTETKDLKVGDRLLAANGDIITVDDISYQAGQIKVYNFEVADNHTYFVGELGVLVHNAEGYGGETTNFERLSLAEIDDRYSGWGKLNIPIEAFLNGIRGNGFSRDYVKNETSGSLSSYLSPKVEETLFNSLNKMTTSMYFDKDAEGNLVRIEKTGAKEEYNLAKTLLKDVFGDKNYGIRFMEADATDTKGTEHYPPMAGLRESLIKLNPAVDATVGNFFMVDGKPTMQYLTDPIMVIAHELIHVNRHRLGVNVPANNPVETVIFSPDGYRIGAISKEKEEVETVGEGILLASPSTFETNYLGITENQLRAERGEPIRLTYASSTAPRKEGEVKWLN